MNQTQRNFLIEKIRKQTEITASALTSSKKESPNYNNLLLHAVLSNKFEIVSIEAIKETIIKKAKEARSGQDWLSNSRSAFSSYDRGEVVFQIKDIFKFSKEIQDQMDEWKAESDKIREEICNVTVQAENLILRIQLSSDKVLERLINEVNDMGDLSLMDTKIKLLSQ